jgi:RNA-directed DNA polymerase
LTSQILANIYLNEFDRFVRHELKPLAYVRYGDDFLLFARTRAEAKSYQNIAQEWLVKYLSLRLHSRNNVIIQPKQGVHVLGHWIYPKHQIIVDSMMKHKIRKNLNRSNVATYKSMYVPAREQHLMSHLLTKRIRIQKKH